MRLSDAIFLADEKITLSTYTIAHLCDAISGFSNCTPLAAFNVAYLRY